MKWSLVTLIFCLLQMVFPILAQSGTRPHIVVYLADDLGMANIQAYDSSSRIPTPQMNRLAAEGCLFFDVHSPAAVCTLTRDALLTGRYPFRSRLESPVLYAACEEPLLKGEQETIGGMLKRGGYRTTAFGKWHLGIDWASTGGVDPARPGVNASKFTTREVDFSKPIRHHAVDHGFDYFFGLGSSINHGPYTFIENDRVTSLPTRFRDEWRPAEGGGAFREGWVVESWDDTLTCPRILTAAVDHVREHLKSKNSQPLFVYYASLAPHTPWIPPERAGDRQVRGAGGEDDNRPRHNDMVVMNDIEVGALRGAFEDLDGDGDAGDSVLNETLFIVTSDNGACVGFFKPYRGKKGSIYEGGHRVPFIARWPAAIPVGERSDALFGLHDLFATFAEIAGVPMLEGTAGDSRSMWAALSGSGPGRTSIAIQKSGGSETFVWREGFWKLVMSGDGSSELYHLGEDPGEESDLATARPQQVAAMKAALVEVLGTGKSSRQEEQGGNLQKDGRLTMLKA